MTIAADLSVCTIVRGRRGHLVSQMRGLARQRRPPAELVIGYAQPEPFEGLPEVAFPVRAVVVGGDAMPFARARNACAELASGAVLAFVDVDCTPGPDLVGTLEAAVRPGRCPMGHVRYLAADDSDPGDDFDAAWAVAEPHPARRFDAGHGGEGTGEPDGRAVRSLDDPGEFWSTVFALTRADWARTGGFDEGYLGYGGEDTDFGRALAGAGIGLDWCEGARALHRWHRVQVPPLDALGSIVTNVRRFRAKHGAWCMDYWLDQFEAGGWVRRDPDAVEILREPSAEERELARQPASVRFG